MHTRSASELLGLVTGAALAPLFGLGSVVRRARVLHPNGLLLRGVATALPEDSELAALGSRLAGPVLARFSSGWWKEREWPDVLGCALRFTRAEVPSAEAQHGDQDLLLATVRVPLTTLLAPLTTHVDDYLRNHYFGVSPFEAGMRDRIKLRLSPDGPAPELDTRAERLNAALAEGPIGFVLHARAARLAAQYSPILRIELSQRVELDQEQLRFNPFRTGRELEPAGFIHALRIPAYAASRTGRAAAAK